MNDAFANIMETAKLNAAETDEHKKFADKFKPKKTTDDCYTPPYIYDVILNWAVEEYNLQGREIVRPFYPGGDYKNYKYPSGCVVVDNPPFSRLAEICDFYLANHIDFFIFAQTNTLFSTGARDLNYVIINESIIYENGAKVATSFITNMGDFKINVCGDLNDKIKNVKKRAWQENKKSLPKYQYSENVASAALLRKIAGGGINLKIRNSDTYFVRKLDEQAKNKKAIYGAGFLLSNKAAAERAAAERAASVAAQVWKLSDREINIIKSLGEN